MNREAMLHAITHRRSSDEAEAPLVSERAHEPKKEKVVQESLRRILDTPSTFSKPKLGEEIAVALKKNSLQVQYSTHPVWEVVAEKRLTRRLFYSDSFLTNGKFDLSKFVHEMANRDYKLENLSDDLREYAENGNEIAADLDKEIEPNGLGYEVRILNPRFRENWFI
jgi:hypothetical protein